MNFRMKYLISFSVALVFLLNSCKRDWLDAKPDRLLVVPQKITDFQALLDNSTAIFNFFQASGLGEIAAGDFYILYNSWLTLYGNQERSAYIWEETAKFYGGEISNDWQYAYKRILSANVVLNGIEKIKPSEDQKAAWSNVKGSALFFRAFDFYGLTQEYCRAYSGTSAATDPGLPLRLDYDVNLKVYRSSLQQTYDQIINDLSASAVLLPDTPVALTRPSKKAAYALLARTFLAMENYQSAGRYADSALNIGDELLNYSSINVASYPFKKFNKEVIFHSTFTYGIFNASRLLVEPELYKSYTEDDYRRTLFFNTVANGVNFRGSYSGDRTLFGGLTTDELFLIRAECNARNGDVSKAMEDLNRLLRTRFKDGYTDLTADNAEKALELVLRERRKELVFRGTRWSDLRRLNRDSRFKVTLKRTLNGTEYVLKPDDKRYVFPIDDYEVASGIVQNDR
ncbi:RagB/SusD family nutrient uptake outer membrane protein [Pedobacter sp. JY14-1]|uniref:RagB/SusD family nutrient uptake outer membrane protein n=1 Tax=Pedobacter sp. JY14-1 TaxID=3034151 RepID=UPI0023E1840F|nr:RagB/SusD family nutrient uptake outer membrane protein [Pedobacter sp. JY14-1]